MRKGHLSTAALGVAAILLAALPAQAASLSSAQIQLIVQFLQSFGADQATIGNVEAVLAGTPAPASSCATLSRDLTLGSSGGDVTDLQNYLAEKSYFTYASGATGYYGFLTAQAVGKLQVADGIVPSADDPAYGIMGPKTRAAIRCGTQPNVTQFNANPTSGTAQSASSSPSISQTQAPSTAPQTTPPLQPISSVRIEASPTYGSAPLPVSFSANSGDADSNTFYIDFGDGTSGQAGVLSTWHTYNSAGTYIAALRRTVPPSGAAASLVITVAASSQPASASPSPAPTSPSPSVSFNASPSSGPAPLAVSFSASGLSPNTNYTITFSDGQYGVMLPTCVQGTACGSYLLSHTYQNAGTYTATFFGPNPSLNSPTCQVEKCASTIPIATATVTVTAAASPTSSSGSASSSSGSTPASGSTGGYVPGSGCTGDYCPR